MKSRLERYVKNFLVVVAMALLAGLNFGDSVLVAVFFGYTLQLMAFEKRQDLHLNLVLPVMYFFIAWLLSLFRIAGGVFGVFGIAMALFVIFVAECQRANNWSQWHHIPAFLLNLALAIALQVILLKAYSASMIASAISASLSLLLFVYAGANLLEFKIPTNWDWRLKKQNNKP